jgi:excisionase family DNA binding protein
MFSLSQTAKRTGVSKATIHRAIKSGKLSAHRQDDDSYKIDPSELSRVYEMKTGTEVEGGTPEMATEPVSRGSGETIRNPSRNAPENPSAAILQAELAGARQLIKFLEEQVEDLRGDRDGWRQQAETAQRLLTHARERAVPTPMRPWWKRLAG